MRGNPLKERKMSSDSGKVTAGPLRRDAYLYVRQSTLYQVIHNTESTRRQYDLKGRAVALVSQPSQVHVIDVDQGCSGASAADPARFQPLRTARITAPPLRHESRHRA